MIFVGGDCSQDWHDDINFSIDILFLVDILVNFNTAYYDEMAVIIRDRKKIAENYSRYTEYFAWSDLVCNLILNLIVEATEAGFCLISSLAFLWIVLHAS